MNGLGHVLGLDNPSGAWYLFWSGPGSDISELALLGGIIGLLRKHNCAVHGCWRIGRHSVFDPQTQVQHCVCRRHNPQGRITAQHIDNIVATQQGEGNGNNSKGPSDSDGRDRRR